MEIKPGGLFILLTSTQFLQKLPIFWKITFMTSRVKNYVLIINLGSRGFLIDISEFYDVYKYFVLKTK